MTVLALECSATPASAAIIKDGKLIASSFANIKITHSETLIPIITDMLKNSRLALNDIDGFAVSVGPGSFTGVRIGISAIKGFTVSTGKKCAAVSTLEAIAYGGVAYENAIICAVMDARCNQVYNALFKVKNGKPERLCEDRAVYSADLIGELLKEYPDEKIVVMGDGTDVFMPFAKENKNITPAPEIYRFQNAASVAFVSEEYFKKGNTLSAIEIMPLYLRLPQAERELNKRSR